MPLHEETIVDGLRIAKGIDLVLIMMVRSLEDFPIPPFSITLDFLEALNPTYTKAWNNRTLC